MWCSDFIFDGERLSDHGFILCSFDSNQDSWSGGEVTFTTVKPPSSDINDYYTSSFDSPIVFTMQIGKNPCGNDAQADMYLTQDDMSDLHRWLSRPDGFHWLNFDQDGFEDVYFNTYFNLSPEYFNGHVIGYTLTGTTDSPHGYSQLLNKKVELQPKEVFSFKVYSDKAGIIKPVVTIKPSSAGEIKLVSGNWTIGENGAIKSNYIRDTWINATTTNEIVLDEQNDFYSGITNPNYFDFSFPIIATSYSDITTRFRNDSDFPINLGIQYRQVRRVNI